MSLLHGQTLKLPLHFPDLQTSPLLQARPSSQLALLAVCAQPLSPTPKPGKQASSVHGLPSSHFCLAPGMQVPAAHKSPIVQEFPSLQLTSPGKAAATQQPIPSPPLLQTSLVQGFLSSHWPSLTQPHPGVPTQVPAIHTSPLVKVLPSSHVTLLGRKTQLPVLPSHLSSVHALLSAQRMDAPPTHLPPAHMSALVQALPSLHGLWLLLKLQPFLRSQPSSVHGLPSSHVGALPPLHLPWTH